MLSRSARDKSTGLMKVVCTDWNGDVFFEGEYADFFEAEKAGADAERRMTVAMMTPQQTIDQLLAGLDDIELLLELGL